MLSRRHSSVSSIAVLAFSLTAVTSVPSLLRAQATQHGGAELSADLVAVRTALDKYKDPILAVHDGYFSSVGCLEYSTGMSGHGAMDYKAGGMGVHFLNTANIGPVLDPMKPQVLIYEPVGDKFVLAAAEWFVPTAVSKDPPTIFGQGTAGTEMEGHEPVLPVGTPSLGSSRVAVEDESEWLVQFDQPRPQVPEVALFVRRQTTQDCEAVKTLSVPAVGDSR